MAKRSGNIEFRPRGVSDSFAERVGIPFEYLVADDIQEMMLPRDEYAHKGTYGHALFVCGSRGMMGSAILATGAALRSGCGLVTAHVPQGEHVALSANYPSAMLSLDEGNFLSTVPAGIEKYNAIGAGPGLGRAPETVRALEEIILRAAAGGIKLVLDADALNIISGNGKLLDILPPDTVMTPHEGELKRLTGEWQSEEEKITKAMRFSAEHSCIIVVKGANTMVCNAGKRLVFNSTGNSGMAKGGSGDVLTGFITGLIARGYSPENAALAGVYIHGLAGDKARDYYGAEGMNSADIIDFLAEGLLEFQ